MQPQLIHAQSKPAPTQRARQRQSIRTKRQTDAIDRREEDEQETEREEERPTSGKTEFYLQVSTETSEQKEPAGPGRRRSRRCVKEHFNDWNKHTAASLLPDVTQTQKAENKCFTLIHSGVLVLFVSAGRLPGFGSSISYVVTDSWAVWWFCCQLTALVSEQMNRTYLITD